MKMYRALLLIAVCLLSLHTEAEFTCQVCNKKAETFIEDKFHYTIINTNEVSISLYRDTVNIALPVDSMIQIPATVEHHGTQYKVTRIAKNAFCRCYGLKHINIHEGIEVILNHAFSRCTQLESIHIPSTVEALDDAICSNCPLLSSITVDERNENYDSRNGCNAIIETSTNRLIAGCLTTTIPNSVITIGSSAFYGCSSLKDITVPEGVQNIENSAFGECYNLESILLPNSLLRLGDLDRCRSLKKIAIPQNVRDIQYGAFRYCAALKEITVDSRNKTYDSRNGCNAIVETQSNKLIAACTNTHIVKSITSIGPMAFGGTMLTAIDIPATITLIEENPFADNVLLHSITVNEKNPKYNSANGGNILMETATNKVIAGCINSVIPQSAKTIGEFAFFNQPMPATLTLPEGVDSIETHALSGCPGMERVITPHSTKHIASFAFSNNKSLWEVILNGNIETINSYTFENCPNLYYINIPPTVSTIKWSAFEGCRNLSCITIPPTLKNIAKYAFKGCPVEHTLKERDLLRK